MDMPVDIWLAIFGFLPKRPLFAAACANKAFTTTALSILWRVIDARRALPAVPPHRRALYDPLIQTLKLDWDEDEMC